MSSAQSTNVLRLPTTQIGTNYQAWFGGFDWASPTNFTDGSYANNWYGTAGANTISYRLDRLYDLNTFYYGDNTGPVPNGRVNTFEIAAGSGPVQSYTDTSVSGATVTPMTGAITRRGGYVRWRSTSVSDGNNGGSEFEVWGTPTWHLRIPNPSIYTNYPEYSANYPVTAIFNNVLGLVFQSEYASAGGDVNTYIVFDFSVPTKVSAVEIWDRAGASGIQSAQLIFSDNLTFGDAGDVTVPYSKTASDPATLVDLVAQGYPNGITRRYLKWKVTVNGGDGNNGMGEIAFYATPPEGTIVNQR
jgi:hypothetical protein